MVAKPLSRRRRCWTACRRSIVAGRPIGRISRRREKSCNAIVLVSIEAGLGGMATSRTGACGCRASVGRGSRARWPRWGRTRIVRRLAPSA